MKPMRQMVCALLAVTLLLPAAAASPGSGNPLWDVQGHWAQKEIQEAVAAGWVDGYPDGSFQPEKTITRAEFTKLLLDAIHLTPDSETVAWMTETATTKDGRYSEKKYVPILNDMDGHWLTTQGWTDAALYSGMVVPDDYNGKNFRPEKEIARYEIALMTDRALGLVYPANQYAGEDLPFADNAEILDWMKGYVNESVKAGVLKGYPDGSFQPNKTSTRAEAVVMIQRMLEEMEEGLNHDITVVARYKENYKEHGEEGTILQEEETDQIQLQVIDNIIYASLNDMYDVEIDLIKKYGKESADKLGVAWWPIQQEMIAGITNVSSGSLYYYQMGNEIYYWESNGSEKMFCAPTRALYGELMVPVCDLSHYSREAQDEWKGGWDPETNTLTLLMYYRVPPERYS